MNEKLVQLAVTHAPAVIEMLKGLFRRENPTAPEPTNEEVMAAYHQAFGSLAVDEAWLKANPPQNG